MDNIVFTAVSVAPISINAVAPWVEFYAVKPEIITDGNGIQTVNYSVLMPGKAFLA